MKTEGKIMKKILFATTALVATASVAAADVTMSGMARFGIQKSEGADATVDSRVNIDIKGSGETESGISFGGKIRMRGTDGATTLNGAQVHMSSGGVTVYAGNIPGPIDSMSGTYAKTVGFTGGTFNAYVGGGDSLAYTSTGTGSNGLQVNYAAGPLTVAVAHSPVTEDEQVVVEYAMGALTLAAGAQLGNVDADDVTVATASYSLGDWSMVVAYGDNNGTTQTSFGVSGAIAAATSLSAYASDKDGATDSAFGIGLSHDLGGASLGVAYESSFTGTSVMEAGVTFNF
jgi:outer membrane protein OmpU